MALFVCMLRGAPCPSDARRRFAVAHWRPWLCCLAAVLFTSCSGCDATSAARAPQRDLPEVFLAQPVVRTVRREAEYPGQIEPSQRVEVRAPAAGRLVAVATAGDVGATEFIDGSLVAAGQILFCLDRASFDARLRAAQAVKRGAEARLQRAQQAFVAAGQRRSGATDAQTSQALDGELASAAAARDDASAALASADIDLQWAQAALDQCTIRAPIGGWVGERAADIGNRVEAGARLTTIINTDDVRVAFEVRLAELQRLARLQYAALRTHVPLQVRVMFEGDDSSLDATIDYVAPELDLRRGTGRVRATIPNHAGKLMPGMAVRVQVAGDAHDDVMLIEPRAVRTDLGGEFVWVVADGRARPRYVELGAEVDGLRVVSPRRDAASPTGLEPTESYVTDGLLRPPPGAAMAVPVRVAGRAAPGDDAKAAGAVSTP